MGPCRPILISHPSVYCFSPFDGSTVSRLYCRERGQKVRERESERERDVCPYCTATLVFTYPPSDIPSPTMSALG